MKIFGDRNTFAVEFSFVSDPDNGKATLPEYSASWGQLALWVEGKNLCQYMYKGEVQQHIVWYFLPLLEWLAKNWGALFYEEAPPCLANQGSDARGLFFAYGKQRYGLMSETHEDAWYAWGQRHSLRACAEGGIFPDLYMRARGENVEFSWGNANFPGMPEELYFTVPCDAASVKRAAVAPHMQNFLKWAVAYLTEKLPHSPRVVTLRDEMSTLQNSLEANVDWIIPAVRDKKLTFADIMGKIHGVMSEVDFSDGLPAPVLMFGSCSPNINTKDIDRILKGIAIGQESQCCLKYVDNQSVHVGEHPYEQGYDAAQDFLDVWDGDLSEGFVDIKAILENLGVRVLYENFYDAGIRGIAMAGKGLIPTIFVNGAHKKNTNEQGRRYTLAHELCHILHDREYGQELGVVSGPWAPLSVEKRANAFAAMLLMPTSMLEGSCNSVAEGNVHALKSMADHFRVNSSALVEHLYNMGCIDWQTRDDLRCACDN